MAAAAGILNQQTAAQALTGRAAPMDTAGSGSSSGTSATITANDFLTLLVTEMQNQDPTANTDPNEYINQLVQVNSLQQLIGINETLTGALGTSSATTKNGTAVAQAVSGTGQNAAMQACRLPSSEQAPGNLSIPAASSASQRIAHALDGHTTRLQRQ